MNAKMSLHRYKYGGGKVPSWQAAVDEALFAGIKSEMLQTLVKNGLLTVQGETSSENLKEIKVNKSEHV